MEIEQLLNAIMEVSQSVARMPCPPESKAEVLDNIKTLFSCYKGIASLLRSYSSKSEQTEKLTAVDGASYQSEKVPADLNNELCENKRKIKDMDGKLMSLEQRFSSDYVISCQSTEKSITDLKLGLAASKTSMDQLEVAQNIIGNRVTVIENKSNDLEILKTQMAKMMSVAEKSETVSQKTVTQDQLLALQLKITDLESVINNPRGSQKVTAFSAKSVGSTRYKAGATIQFKKVQCNVNDCYDPADSIFRSKSAGLYAFSSSINTDSVGVFEVAIVHNGEEVNYFAASGQKDSQTGLFTVIYLQPGDTVCVKVALQLIRFANLPGVMISSCFSNFTGYKID